MLVDSIEIKVSKKDALKNMIEKIPLISKIVQFNKTIKDVNLRYIEYEVLKYKVNRRDGELLRGDYKIFIVNTYTGYTNMVDKIPETVKRYISKDCVEQNKINDFILKNNVRCEIEKYYRKFEEEDIYLVDKFSIYKPYWTCKYNGKNIFLEA